MHAHHELERVCTSWLCFSKGKAALGLPVGLLLLVVSHFAHLISRGPDLLVETRGPRYGLGGAAHLDTFISWAAAQAGRSDFEMMGRGPAWPIRFSDDGPRPDPINQISRILGRGRDPAWLVPFQFITPRPAWPGPGRPNQSIFHTFLPKESILRSCMLEAIKEKLLQRGQSGGRAPT